MENKAKIGENKESGRNGVVSTATATTPAPLEGDNMADSAHDSTTGKSPAFQFYPKDFLTDPNVIAMSMHERGVYITLLCLCWQNPLPADVSRLARLCGTPVSAFRKLWPALAICFRPHPTESGLLIHPRLERERAKQAEYRNERSTAGKRGADKRWHGRAIAKPVDKGSSATTEPMAKHSSSSSSSSAVSSSDFGQERARASRGIGGGAGAGSFLRDHLNCRGNGIRCDRVCVSERQHAILCQRFGGDPQKADDALDAFYAEVRERLDPNQPIGDTPWKFWEAQFTAKFGTVAGSSNPRTAGNVAAAARFVARGRV